jgi:hypothetical protein
LLIRSSPVYKYNKGTGLKKARQLMNQPGLISWTERRILPAVIDLGGTLIDNKEVHIFVGSG